MAEWRSGEAATIGILTLTEAIRKRPAMYVGPIVNPMLPNNLLKEALEVAFVIVDKVTEVNVTFCRLLGEVRVSFNASFPVALHPSGKREAEMLMTEQRSLKAEAPKLGTLSLDSLGLDSLGLVSLVTLCSEFDFNTCSEGYEWIQSFEKGIPGEFVRTVECDAKRTEFMFTLDESIFDANRRFDAEAIRSWLAETFTPEQFTVEDYQPSL